MRLTIDARLVKSSGIGVYLQNIIKSPLLDQYELRLILKNNDLDYFRQLCLKAELVEFDAEMYSLKELLYSSAKTINSDIFWSPHYNVPIINFARLSVVTIHDVFHLAYYHTLSTAQKAYAKIMVNRAVRSDIIFTVSEFSKAEIIKYTSCNPEKIKVIYNGIDFEKFNKRLPEELAWQVLKVYNLSSPYILFVGNVKPHKNLKTALQGFEEFIKSSPNFREYKFVIAGKREGFITGDKEIERLLSQPFYCGKIQFTGWVKDEHLGILYQNAALFIFPSVYEGFGFPPLEAMAAGCPVISSNSACMPEIYGDAALFFNALKKTEIADAFYTVLANSEKKNNLIKKGLNQSKGYNWDKAVNQKLKYMEEFLEAN
jgi:glycosyltransferase involved in cell wall biosynthesis